MAGSNIFLNGSNFYDSKIIGNARPNEQINKLIEFFHEFKDEK